MQPALVIDSLYTCMDNFTVSSHMENKEPLFSFSNHLSNNRVWCTSSNTYKYKNDQFISMKHLTRKSQIYHFQAFDKKNNKTHVRDWKTCIGNSKPLHHNIIDPGVTLPIVSFGLNALNTTVISEWAISSILLAQSIHMLAQNYGIHEGDQAPQVI